MWNALVSSVVEKVTPVLRAVRLICHQEVHLLLWRIFIFELSFGMVERHTADLAAETDVGVIFGLGLEVGIVANGQRRKGLCCWI